MNHELEIVPHQGFADVHFGMTRAQVLVELGEPKTIRTAYAGKDIQDTEWLYPKLGVTLCFSHEDDDTLGTISFESEEATLWGSQPIHMPIHRYRDVFKVEAGAVLLLEDEYVELDAEDYWCDALGLLVYVESGAISRISIFRENK